VQATVRVDPPSAARDADWLTAMAWQGGGLHIDHLRRIGPGLWRTTSPLPVHGDWKALIRLHHGRSIAAVPVYLPEDAAIPVPGLSAPARFTRPFVLERNVLQRERKSDVPGSLATIAYSAVGSIFLALFALLGWALARLGVAGGAIRPRRRRVARPVVAPGGVS
jgi:hypothetical protein